MPVLLRIYVLSVRGVNNGGDRWVNSCRVTGKSGNLPNYVLLHWVDLLRHMSLSGGCELILILPFWDEPWGKRHVRRQC